nr:sulfatase [Aeoliella straminimaris]
MDITRRYTTRPVLNLACWSVLIAAWGGFSVAALGNESAPTQPKNVVLFLIDDLGWTDLGCYGSDYYQTPHIDSLAAKGMRFTDAYSACSVCSPTRAAIMTGKYPARLLLTQWLPSGRWNPTNNRMREGRYISDLPLEEVTIAEALRKAGYRTGFFGKWHLGSDSYYSPEHNGFDVNVAGSDYGAPGSYFYPYEGTWKIPTTDQVYFKRNMLSGKPGDYLTDRLTEEAERFIRDNAESPFFVMLSHYAVHTPLQGKPEKMQRYKSIAKRKRQGPPSYAAMIESVDDSIGSVMQVLQDLDLEDNTLVIFTSDNGGFAKATNNAPLRANKGSSYEGGIRVPLIVYWPGKTGPGSTTKEPATSADLYPTILEALGLPARPYQHIDGVSLAPVLSSDGKLQREAIYWHYPHYNQHPQSFPSSVIRAGDWKLIENLETGQRQLFNLAEDLGEQTDLSQSQPAKAAELAEKLEAWRQEVGADPMRPNPQFRDDTTDRQAAAASTHLD